MPGKGIAGLPDQRFKMGVFMGSKALKVIVFLVLLVAIACESYPVVDFQQDRCRQPPSGSIKATDQGNRRWELALEDVSTTVETEPFRIMWTIEGQNFAAQRVSYQFERRGEQQVIVVMTNRCFMQTTKEVSLTIK